MAKVQLFSVTDLQVFDQRTVGAGRLGIFVSGLARTSGWTETELRPRTPNAVPANGVLEFDLVGEPPQSGTIVLHVLSPKSAAIIWETDAARVRIVRVYADTNSRTRNLDRPFKTLEVGEEQEPTQFHPSFEDLVVEFPPRTTYRFGEEGQKTFRFGEEDPSNFVAEKLPVAGGEIPRTGPIGEIDKTAVGEVPPDLIDRIRPDDISEIFGRFER
jgi:hypothetical protein